MRLLAGQHEYARILVGDSQRQNAEPEGYGATYIPERYQTIVLLWSCGSHWKALSHKILDKS
jgi:hypothetical protein